MKMTLKPIALDETSYNVNLLHKALTALGLSISKKEIAQSRAGKTTLKRVRSLQKALNVPVDESTLVDQVTAVAMADALKKMELTTASRSFTVSGAVRKLNGNPQKRLRLLAFDLDLRGVAIYRTVQDLAAIRANSGFEYLGQAVSDNQGLYRITFYDWQYRRAERKKADVVVYALDGNKVIGLSPIVNSAAYSDKGLVRDLDIVITQEDEGTEYQRLMTVLTAFLKESRTSLAEMATSPDQLAFTAGELDVDLAHLDLAAAAELLVKQVKAVRGHELLYGIGRQNIRLSWEALYKNQEEGLRTAVVRSMDEGIISPFPDEELAVLLKQIRERSGQNLLDDQDQEGDPNTLNVMLRNALPKKEQRLSFINALGNFTGSDFREFWEHHLPAQPEFKDTPELVSALLLTQQFTLLSGNHQKLVAELQGHRGVTSMDQLLELKDGDWLELLKGTGVPDFVEGDDDEDRIKRYAGQMQSLLNAAFPTRRIAQMVTKGELPIKETRVARGFSTFLAENKSFDFASSRIHNFDREIEAAAGEDVAEVRSELLKFQRVFQVSPSPGAMQVLLESGLHSAYAIANIPRKTFINSYGEALGGEHIAFAAHQRATHISTRAEMAALHLQEYSHSATPQLVMGKTEYNTAMATIQAQLPNYPELFGSPDLCECEHCRSVYSAAAYFVDLLRFLEKSGANDDGHTTYDILVGKTDSSTNTVEVKGRRPDLALLPLTCENSNTLIPYIDMVNEVMEYYTVHNSLTDFQGHNTGDTKAEELRANPQNFNLAAYQTLKDAKYPFTLPYHQPLDVIRTYSDHLGVSRYQAMKAINPQPDAPAAQAIAAESLGLSPEAYLILTDTDPTDVHLYFGYPDGASFENMQDETGANNNPRGIRPLLERTGLSYLELVELVKTRFINPHQGTLDFLQAVFSASSLEATTIYTRLEEIEAGTLNAAGRNILETVLDAYNGAAENTLSFVQFEAWVTDHLDEFRQVITLYESDSKCGLETTRLRTIQSIYEGEPTPDISNSTWSKIHRFIRLWHALGWTMHQTDLILTALGETDLTPETIGKLEVVSLLQTATRLPLSQLAVLWGNIDTVGDQALYKKLFLNKAVQHIDEAFNADATGNYLHNNSENLAAHQSSILAAFGIREADLVAILEVAQVFDNGTPRPINFDLDILNLQNLSTLYRYLVLARGLKMQLTDVCQLIKLFGATPFSIWDLQQEEFTSISPADSYKFYELAVSTKQAGFTASLLEYILQGNLPPASTLGLDPAATRQAAKAIRETLASIEQEHADTLETKTPKVLSAKLSLTYQSETARRLLDVIGGTAVFDTKTDLNLNVTIPPHLAEKYSYSNGSGRMSCTGIMSIDERDELKALSNSNFHTAVDDLYTAPETFISDNFSGLFSDLDEANEVLLDRPSQNAAASLETQLDYVYEHFVPLLKNKLRQEVITQHVAALIGLSETATALLIANDMDDLIIDLFEAGFSAAYFNAINWDDSDLALERTDSKIDFFWDSTAPDPLVSANNFSVRWRAFLAAPAAGAYGLVVRVAEADEAFNLYLDDTLILAKPAGNPTLLWERDIDLHAAQMHLLTLEYAEASQNAGIRLSWKTTTTVLETVPASATYPADILDEFVSQVSRFHRAAQFISGFAINETELHHLINHSGDFDNLNFNALEAAHWQRIRDYTTLRQAVPQAQALLTDVFALVTTQNPAPSVNDLAKKLSLATTWDQANLAFLATHFALDVDDFKNELALNRLQTVMQIVAKTGLSAKTIATWGALETGFEALHDTAQLLKNTVKAKYDPETWLDVAGNLSDKIRENQKQALISHLLVQPDIQAQGVSNADGLFEYFLIDVQMGACMDTSRIVQASAAIQLFVNRCLLNLERGVSPSAIDQDRWQWMKNYRVWEANRKVFLYPENWLEPEWRNDRSQFFRELESHLVQNDITQRSVEQGFRNYLTSLNEVANLEVCGMHQENDDDGKLKYLHVFGRTHNAPYKYFYRTRNEFQKWSAWERLQLDIRSVENGDNSGVHLIPVVWKSRLFLFWPEYIEKPKESSSSGDQTIREKGDDPMFTLEPTKYWEIRLAWSEYVAGQWSPKQVSKEFVEYECNIFVPDESKMWFATEINENKLSIYLATQGIFGVIAPTKTTSNLPVTGTPFSSWWNLSGRFELSDIASKVNVESGGLGLTKNQWDQTYSINFVNFAGSSSLRLLDNTYLKTSSSHKILLTAESRNFTPSFAEPFFFSDAFRTYFVRPVDISVIDLLRQPDHHPPVIEKIVDGAGPPNNMPLLGSGDARAATRLNTGVVNRATVEMGHISVALGIEGEVASPRPSTLRPTKGFEFHTFYHPFSSKYVTNLNQGGLSALMDSDTEDPELFSDDGNTFKQVYDPNFSQGRVQKPADFDRRTYYKEEVSFDPYSANSLYNWELFFHAPLYIATRLSKNGKYKKAMQWFHYIFDPTTDAMPGDSESETSRYWKVLPFKTTEAESLEIWFRNLNGETDPLSPDYNSNSELSDIVSAWLDKPFEPHVVASNRPIAYMKHVVVKYVENLIAWGDSLFRQFTRESVYEAIQIYVIANHILGPRPEFVPKRGKIKAETYASLQDTWDGFANALVELENIFPYSSEVAVSTVSPGPSLLGIGSALYFCIPANDKLLGYWDTVADRLFKIRHCQDIEGVDRGLALFAPPIDPALLIQATAQGLSLGDILTNLSSPPPIYRFSFLMQKANEFCAEVKGLGSTLLAALEKKDGEELSRLRASHETNMLELVTAIRERQILAARANKENLLKARETAGFRLNHYSTLLGTESIEVPDVPTIEATLTADSQLPSDVDIPEVETGLDKESVGNDESGVTLISREKEELDLNELVKYINMGVNTAESLAAVLNAIPTFNVLGAPLGVGAGTESGGFNWANAVSAGARAGRGFGDYYSTGAILASKMAAYVRREVEWTFQANLIIWEIVQLDKQIISADIQIQVAEKELQNHQQQIETSKEVELFLKDQFTNQELYQWMKEQLLAVYKQSYNLAHDMAKKAEKAYQYELGLETTNFVQYGYWDSAKQGLVSGEKLQLALRQLEESYLDQNRRGPELTKSFSLLLLNPLALIELRETGKCIMSLPEELFDLDFQGHYFRRIKAVSLSIPCITGPFTTVNCTLRLLSNTTRINTSLNGGYEHANDAGLWIDDDRFRASHVPVTSIATSRGQSDSGMFEFSFRDERYLPFEGAGVISRWAIELSTHEDLRQFDYTKIADVIVQLNYTAREGGSQFKANAETHITDFIQTDQPLIRMLNLKQEHPSAWHKFLHPTADGEEQVLKFTIGKESFPFLAQHRRVIVTKIELLAKCTEAETYPIILAYNEGAVVSPADTVILEPDNNYGGLNTATINTADLNLEALDVSKGMSLKMKRNSGQDFASLSTNPDEVEDLFLVVHYKLN